MHSNRPAQTIKYAERRNQCGTPGARELSRHIYPSFPHHVPPHPPPCTIVLRYRPQPAPRMVFVHHLYYHAMSPHRVSTSSLHIESPHRVSTKRQLQPITAG